MEATVRNIDNIRLSIIICTYNPVESIFTRCLNAIYIASKEFGLSEIVIVDNNSSDKVAEKQYILDFQRKLDNVKIVREEKQGLTPARLRGIRETSARSVKYFSLILSFGMK